MTNKLNVTNKYLFCEYYVLINDPKTCDVTKISTTKGNRNEAEFQNTSYSIELYH